MVAAGASGYLMKTSAPENVINPIRIVNDGGTYFDPTVSRDHSTAAAPPRPRLENLPPANWP